jgi:glutamyl-tRNA synthetase
MVRTRIAPSPTGSPHVGTAYIALFNYCFAKKSGGEFILRIEDTDQQRSTREYETAILESLRWLGLRWEEGPDVGGPHGPYRQSERTELYQQQIKVLLEAGHAFHCFCTAERLDALRREQSAAKGAIGYDGFCLRLSEQEVKARIAQGEPHVVRMKVPAEGTCVVRDRLREPVEIPWQQIDMQVLIKADGLPTYHLANVVDDHFMEITHVLRGEEWISSAPKHLLLYQYFGWTPPELCHLPLLRNPDKSKLSKRKNPTGIEYYRRTGFLPEALLNYLGRMGWSMPDDREKFTLAEMVEDFSLDRISLGGPIFDLEKLKWLNGRWIREDLSDDAFADRVAEWALNREYLSKLVPMLKPRVETLADLAPKAAHFFVAAPTLSAADFQHKKIQPSDSKRILQVVAWRVEGVRAWTPEGIRAGIEEVASAMNLKLRDFLFPLFIAITGQAVSTPIFETMAIIGQELCRARLRQAITVLGGFTSAESEGLAKEFKALLPAGG